MTSPRRGLENSAHGTSTGGAPWWTRAACQRADPEAFTPPPDSYRPMTPAEAAYARTYCARCPVARECFEDALAHGDDYGIRGGIDMAAGGKRRRATPPPPAPAKATPKAKAKKRNPTQELRREADHARALRHRHAGTEPPCGTRAGYHHHRALHEPYCGECRAYRSNAAVAERDRTRTRADEPTPQAAANAARRTRAHEARATLAAHIEDLIEIGADFDRATRETGYRRDTLERLLYRAQRPDLVAKLKRAA